uniref:Uncharacterized protein n=1 Tax=Arundo donax TaxID=35708 RepID=A0A0A8YBF7_ARUDO
MFCTLTISYD